MSEERSIPVLQRYGLVVVLIVLYAILTALQRRPAIVVAPQPTSAPQALAREMIEATPIVHDPQQIWAVDGATREDGKIVAVADASRIVHVNRTQSITIQGWALDARAAKLAGGVAALVDGTHRIAGTYGDLRPDVARFFHTPAYEACGFRLIVPAGSLAPGRHTVELLALSADRSRFYALPRPLTLDIR